MGHPISYDNDLISQELLFKSELFCQLNDNGNDFYNGFINTSPFKTNGNDQQVNKTASMHNIRNVNTSTIYLYQW